MSRHIFAVLAIGIALGIVVGVEIAAVDMAQGRKLVEFWPWWIIAACIVAAAVRAVVQK